MYPSAAALCQSPESHAPTNPQMSPAALHVGRKQVERLMKAPGLPGLVARRHGGTTIRVPGVRVADDLVQRDFRPSAPTDSGSRTSATCGPGVLCTTPTRARVRLARLRPALPPGGDRALDGCSRLRLRQRRLRGVLQNAQERARRPALLADKGRGTHRRLRVHQVLLQPADAATPRSATAHQRSTKESMDKQERPNHPVSTEPGGSPDRHLQGVCAGAAVGRAASRLDRRPTCL
jgi:hypothetical protein